jgi:hypothetical protein
MANGAPCKDELYSAPNENELYRELIEQFYERSVDRYGIDSAQVRMLSQLLSADAD